MELSLHSATLTFTNLVDQRMQVKQADKKMEIQKKLDE